MLDAALDPFASTIPPPPAPKRCACGRVHDAAAWAALPFVGLMPDGDGGALELRNCVCDSTIAVEVPPC